MTYPLHKQVRIRHGEREADVDEKIAPLITELWRAGINAAMSCQAWSGAMNGTIGVIPGVRGGSVYVVFPGGEGNVGRFRRVVRGFRGRNSSKLLHWRLLFPEVGVELWFHPRLLRPLVAYLRRQNAKGA